VSKLTCMIWPLLFHSILLLHPSKPYPLRVTGEFSSVEKLVEIINSEAYPSSPVEAQLINAQTKEYGVRLVQKLDDPGYNTRENRYQCALNYLLGDSSKTFSVRLVGNDPSVLIGDGRRGVIDIADVAKFDSEQPCRPGDRVAGCPGGRDFTAFNVLLHELYEQYQLQVVGHLEPGKVTRGQLKRAHFKAVQKESNFYSLTQERTDAHVGDEYIDIEFTNRIDSSTTHYYVFHHSGNIDRVERVFEASDF
jgi:hypothetical protein